MYPLFLILHSLARWAVVILGVVATVRAFMGWYGKKDWVKVDDRLSLFFTISMDVQMLLGLVLYIFLSPMTQVAFMDFGAAMRTPELRFFAVEHITMMIVAVVLSHVGRALAKKADNPTVKHQRTAIFFALTILAVLLAIPWGSRPLFRFSV